MRWLRRLWARIKYRRHDAELREEIETHRRLMEDDLRGRGWSPEEARRCAARRMGNVTLQRESARGVWIAPWLESLWQDARYGARSLWKSPGFSATTVVTLAIAIGLNVSLFNVFNAVALRGWDVEQPGDVALLHNRPDPDRRFTDRFPFPEYEYLRDHAGSFVGIVARERDPVWIRYGEGTASAGEEGVQASAVSGNFFDVLGIDMALGRGLVPEDDDPSAPAVVVISHGLWLRLFGGDPAVVGRSVRVGDDGIAAPATIVGVTRRGFAGVEPTDADPELFLPLSLMSRVEYDSGEEAQRPFERYVQLSGRLAPGVSRDRAEAELGALSRNFRDSVQLESHGFLLTGTRPIGRPGRLEGELYLGFAGFSAALLLVLLLACGNVGSLQLARALARRREIAVRMSLGAGRGRIVRQVLTEAALLSLVAGAVAVGLASILPDVVLRFLDGDSELPPLDPDGVVLAFALGLALLSSLLFALAPALRATRGGATLAYEARAALDPGGRRLRSWLLAAQIALSLTLLSGASLLTRGLDHVFTADLGFDAHDTAVAQLTVPEELRAPSTLAALIAELDAALETSPLSPVAWTEVAPLNPVRLAGQARRPDQPETRRRLVLHRAMSRAGFDVLDLEFVAGGPYSDRRDTGQVVVNETLARMMWPREEALGREIVFQDETLNVVGVVRDSYLTGVIEIEPVLHRPLTFGSAPRLTRLLFRTDRSGAADELRALVRGVDTRFEVAIEPVTAGIERTLGSRRFSAALAWAIGGIGMGLATVGVFGVFAYAVEERRREVGVRRALGARAGDVVRVLLAANRWSIGAGLAAGTLLSMGAGFALRSYLFGLSPLDPLAYLRVMLLLALAAAIAVVVPSLRALRVDPMAALQSD